MTELDTALMDLTNAISREPVQAYYVSWETWIAIRDQLMERIGGLPWFQPGYMPPAFELMGVPVYPFHMLESE